MRDCDFDELIGKTLVSVENKANEELVFTTDTGRVFMLYHDQNCCESVEIESIVGGLDDLVGTVLLTAEESVNSELEADATWTFYKLATQKGYVDIRWYGSSNGYYSEEVDFVEVIKEYDEVTA